jgi:cytochrome b561
MMAGGALACIGTVQYQQRTKDKKMKGKAMFLHKSVGLLMAGMIIPRIALRLASKVPKLPEGTPVEHLGAKLSHLGAYGLLLTLPVTGVAMGYYGGKGLPFFFTTIPGADKKSKNGKLAGWSWKVHKYAGVALEYLLPIHVGAVGFHAMKGHSILSRITGGSVLGTAAAASGATVAVAGAVSARPSKLPKFPFSMPPL